jgi:hypothetical protein
MLELIHIVGVLQKSFRQMIEAFKSCRKEPDYF